MPAIRATSARYGSHEWRTKAVQATSRDDLAMLRPLVPGGYFPDFLTPSEGQQGFDAGIDALLSTPRSRLRSDLDILAGKHVLPSWSKQLADGDRQAVRRLAEAVRGHFQAVIEPYWEQARAHIDADRARRARAFLDGGAEGLLSSYMPMMRWTAPVLEVDILSDQDLYLGGRGLLLVPSYMSMGTPDYLRDHTLPQVLVYPVEHGIAVAVATRAPHQPLAALIGDTRAAVLESVGEGRSTSELARRVGVSAASISQHTAVLRSAGLDTYRPGRQGRLAHHHPARPGDAGACPRRHRLAHLSLSR
jgi:hypothetical protein